MGAECRLRRRASCTNQPREKPGQHTAGQGPCTHGCEFSFSFLGRSGLRPRAGSGALRSRGCRRRRRARLSPPRGAASPAQPPRAAPAPAQGPHRSRSRSLRHGAPRRSRVPAQGEAAGPAGATSLAGAEAAGGTAPLAGRGCAPVSRGARREKLGDFALPCRRRGWQPPGTGWVLKTLERERRGSFRSARALSGLGTVCFVFSAPLEPVPESRRWQRPLSPARTRRGSARSGSTLTFPGAVVQRRLIHAAARAAWHFVVLPFIRLNKCSAERKIV